jgi:hypothetical protein
MPVFDIRHYRFLRQQPPDMKRLPWASDVPFWESGAGALVVAIVVTLILWWIAT